MARLRRWPGPEALRRAAEEHDRRVGGARENDVQAPDEGFGGIASIMRREGQGKTQQSVRRNHAHQVDDASLSSAARR